MKYIVIVTLSSLVNSPLAGGRVDTFENKHIKLFTDRVKAIGYYNGAKKEIDSVLTFDYIITGVEIDSINI